MNGWEPSVFCEDLGRQIHRLLTIPRGEFCEPSCFRGEQLVKGNVPVPVHPFKGGKQDSQEETRREKRDSQVKCNLEKAVLCVEQEDETVYPTYVQTYVKTTVYRAVVPRLPTNCSMYGSVCLYNKNPHLILST